MAFIESHQSLLTHRKTGRLMRALSISRLEAVGLLHALWWWSLDNAPEGVLAGIDVEDVAEGACWDREPQQLLDALVHAGFMDATDEGLLLHDWMDYAGRLIEKRKSDAARKRAARTGSDAGSGHPADVPRASGGRPADGAGTLHYPTQPDTTAPKGNPVMIAEGSPGGSVAAAAERGAAVTASPVTNRSSPARQGPPSSPKLKTIYGEDSEPMQLARVLRDGILSHKPDARLPRDLQKWAREFDLMPRVDHRARDAVTAVIAYTMRSSFWRKVIFSAEKLREKFDVIESQMREDTDGTRRSSAVQGASRARLAAGAVQPVGEAVPTVKW